MKRIFVAIAAASLAGTVYAGTVVPGVSKDLGVAMEKATENVEKAAEKHKTCVSAYPKLEECTEVHGYWQCTAIRADHKGSCADKPSDLDNFIKAAKGLSGPTAKAVAMSAGGK